LTTIPCQHAAGNWSTHSPEWKFEARGNGATFVTIETSGFRGSDSEIIAQALDSKGGFTSVLAGCKALLEHDVALNLVGDQCPDKNRQIA